MKVQKTFFFAYLLVLLTAPNNSVLAQGDAEEMGQILTNWHCLLGMGNCDPGTFPPGGYEPKTCPTNQENCGLPDLVPDMSTIAGEPDIAFVKRNFTEKDVELLEKCVGGNGTRYLVRMPANAANIGENMTIGTPPQDTPADPTIPEERGFYVWSPSHGHWHLKNLYTMELLEGHDQLVLTRKLSIATGDLVPYCNNLGNPEPTYNFSDFQGISTGWMDTYPSFLPCQYLDVTDIPPGTYTLRVTVNPFCGDPSSQLTAECDCDNNSMEIALQIPDKREFVPDIWASMFRNLDLLFFMSEDQRGPFRK